MLSENTFKENLNFLSETFNFDVTPVYMKLVYQALKDTVNDEHMAGVTNAIMRQTTMKQWNADYGFRGKPAIADWIDAYVPKKRWKIDENTQRVVEIVTKKLSIN